MGGGIAIMREGGGRSEGGKHFGRRCWVEILVPPKVALK